MTKNNPFKELIEGFAVDVAKDSIVQFEEMFHVILDTTIKTINKGKSPIDTKLLLLITNLKHFNEFDLASLAAVMMYKLAEIEMEKSDDDKSQA